MEKTMELRFGGHGFLIKMHPVRKDGTCDIYAVTLNNVTVGEHKDRWDADDQFSNLIVAIGLNSF